MAASQTSLPTKKHDQFQHDASPVTLKKLRFLLSRAVQRFGGAA
jgi:hypothetical protein